MPDGVNAGPVIPGMFAAKANFVEHPELIAQRTTRYANPVVRENLTAGSDRAPVRAVAGGAPHRHMAILEEFGPVKAMVLDKPGTRLRQRDLPTPAPAPGQVLVKVAACGVCRTDLHVVDGELKEPKLPIVPGHEIVGHVCDVGTGVTRFRIGERVGIPWLGHTCGTCRYCRGGQENLCDAPGFTGYQLDGGYAEYTVAEADYCFAIPGTEGDAEAAPWLCAGLIGYR